MQRSSEDQAELLELRKRAERAMHWEWGCESSDTRASEVLGLLVRLLGILTREEK